MRTDRFHRAWALALIFTGCATAPLPGTREQIGGAMRLRTFASPTAYEAYLRAELSAARGEASTALRQLDLAELADPSDGYLTARRVEVMLSAGDLDGARATAEGLVRSNPELAASWLALAAVHARAGDEGAALQAVARASATDPDDPDVRAAAVMFAGGDERAVALARAGAPEARAGDRVLAARATALDPAGMFRRSAAARRRARAFEHAARGEWAQVDAMLSPLVQLDATRVADRVRTIEARVFDGRPADAAVLVEGLALGASMRRSERARLWLLAGRADLAAEEALVARREAADDLLAIRVLGHAWLRLGRVAEGAELLDRVPRDAPATARVVVSRDALAGAIVGGAGGVAGEDAGAPGVAWALGRVEVCAAYDDLGLDAVASRIAVDTLARLADPSMRGARDLVRVARAERLVARGRGADAQWMLASVETPWARHRRAALLARTDATARVLEDLRARSGDAYEDAIADAWTVLVCGARSGACTVEEGAALERASRDAPASPMTLRARAMRSGDRREAAELVRRAASWDPGSPWTASLLRVLGGR